MPVLEEQYIRFDFDDHSWTVFQLDEHSSYRNGIEKLDGTKSIDFLGLHQDTLYLIEVKDFRQYRSQNQPRLTEGELAVEFGQKVRDSIACIIGSYRNPSHTDLYRDYFQKLEADQIIKLVLWLEYDLPAYNPKRRQVKASVQSNIYKQKVRWLYPNSRVLVSNIQNNQLPDTTVTNLPRPLS